MRLPFMPIASSAMALVTPVGPTRSKMAARRAGKLSAQHAPVISTAT